MKSQKNLISTVNLIQGNKIATLINGEIFSLNQMQNSLPFFLSGK
jgi:hypothetical protein